MSFFLHVLYLTHLSLLYNISTIYHVRTYFLFFSLLFQEEQQYTHGACVYGWCILQLFFYLCLFKLGTSVIFGRFYHVLFFLLLQDEFPECSSISNISSDIDGNATYISHEDLDNDSISVSSIKGTGIQTDWSLLWWKNLKDFNEVLFFFFISLLILVQSLFFYLY